MRPTRIRYDRRRETRAAFGLRAFSEAGIAGAIADWYAVVALFRHPLGLLMPHTAIIPRNKDRIADSIGLSSRLIF
jgi:uncharacterized membrane-anchored protein YjiN (DUF445 family)